jgi:hypothetical protein
MKATLLETARQAAEAPPGLYVVHSGSGAYFPVMAMLEDGYARFRGGAGELSTRDAEAIVQTVSAYARGEEEKLQATPSAAVAHAMLDQHFLGPNHLEAAVKQLVWEPDFFLVNEVEGLREPYLNYQ